MTMLTSDDHMHGKARHGESGILTPEPLRASILTDQVRDQAYGTEPCRHNWCCKEPILLGHGGILITLAEREYIDYLFSGFVGPWHR